MESKKREKIYHTLPPIYSENSRVLILGSLPSPKSREVKMYYGNKSNRFWKTLFAVFGESAVTNEEKAAFILRAQARAVGRDRLLRNRGAADSSIRNAEPNDFGLIFRAADIRAVFTTAGRRPLCIKNLRQGKFCLPSPSGANCAVSFSALMESYKKITEYL